MAFARFSYPSYLPKFQITGFSIAYEQTHTIQETFDGENIFQTAWTLPAHPMQCELLLADISLLTEFRRWYQDTLQHGAEWFVVTLAMGGGLRNCVCHFTDSYTVTQISEGLNTPKGIFNVIYRVNFELLIHQSVLDRVPWL